MSQMSLEMISVNQTTKQDHTGSTNPQAFQRDPPLRIVQEAMLRQFGMQVHGPPSLGSVSLTSVNRYE